MKTLIFGLAFFTFSINTFASNSFEIRSLLSSRDQQCTGDLEEYTGEGIIIEVLNKAARKINANLELSYFDESEATGDLSKISYSRVHTYLDHTTNYDAEFYKVSNNLENWFTSLEDDNILLTVAMDIESENYFDLEEKIKRLQETQTPDYDSLARNILRFQFLEDILQKYRELNQCKGDMTTSILAAYDSELDKSFEPNVDRYIPRMGQVIMY